MRRALKISSIVKLSYKDCNGPHDIGRASCTRASQTRSTQRRGTFCIFFRNTHYLGFGCIDVSSTSTGYEPKDARNNSCCEYAALLDATLGNRPLSTRANTSEQNRNPHQHDHLGHTLGAAFGAGFQNTFLRRRNAKILGTLNGPRSSWSENAFPETLRMSTIRAAAPSWRSPKHQRRGKFSSLFFFNGTLRAIQKLPAEPSPVAGGCYEFWRRFALPPR